MGIVSDHQTAGFRGGRPKPALTQWETGEVPFSLPESEAPGWRAAVGQVPRQGATWPALTMVPGKPSRAERKVQGREGIRWQAPRALGAVLVRRA